MTYTSSNQPKRCVFLRFFKPNGRGRESSIKNSSQTTFSRAKSANSPAIGRPRSSHFEGTDIVSAYPETDPSQHCCQVQKTIEQDEGCADRQRTEMRYEKAVKQLEGCLARRVSIDVAQWRGLIEISRSDQIHSLRDKVNQMLQQRQSSPQHRNILESIFTALLPFSKYSLAVAVQGQPLGSPFGLVFAGLLFLISMAEKEITRRDTIGNKLDYISRQLGQLEIVQTLPQVSIETVQLENRAIDVLSAVLTFLAVNIKSESAKLGVIGNILKALVKDDQRDQVDVDLFAAVEEFNSTLTHFGHNVGFRTYEVVEGLRQDLALIKEERARQAKGSQSLTNNPFIVPYQRNMHFTGREKLLETIRNELSKMASKRWNRRLALHGLGGVGKTQLALEYAYSRKDEYDNVYWITAATQMTLFSGFREIAKQTFCLHNILNLKPSDVASEVLSWLNRESKWLLILDNLDDLSVIDGYLPDLSTGHTLITTRDQHYDHIPAEGLEIGPLEFDDAINLLLIRSNTMLNSMAYEDMDARNIKLVMGEIVRELGLLPLAIEQAAGYIREASKDIFKFLPSYRQNRKIHHARISRGNRNYYSKSVATTWFLSFQSIEESNSDASKLLQLLAFLNPDGILLEFLEVGVDGMDDELREIVGNRDRLFEALGELQRFSLIGRQGSHTDEQRITIHRLVQCVIKDEMSSEQYDRMVSTVVSLCNAAFPPWHDWDQALLHRSRLYEDQVVGPVSDVPLIRHDSLGNLLSRLGLFLREDGKYQQANEVLERALKVLEFNGASEIGLSTARAMLAWCYVYQGLYMKAVAFEEQVVESRLRILGNEDPLTLESMADLARIYRVIGQYSKAVELKCHVLSVRRKLFGDEHDNTLMAMTYLAHSYRDMGECQKAAELEEKVLQARMKLFDPEHPTTLQAMAHLGATYHSQGRYREAADLQQKALEAEIRVLGKEHPETIEVMVDLGRTYREMGKLDDAIVLLERAAEGRKTLGGGEHPKTLWARLNLCLAHQKLGTQHCSTGLLEKFEKGMIKALGKTHPWTLTATHSLALSYHQHGQSELACGLLEGVVEKRKAIFGETHPCTMDTLKELELIGTI